LLVASEQSSEVFLPSPVDGVVGPLHLIAGTYYTVNPMAVRSQIDVYGENVRLVGSINRLVHLGSPSLGNWLMVWYACSPIFGETVHVWIGAMMVGSICMTIKEGDVVKRGDEVRGLAFSVWELQLTKPTDLFLLHQS
jgi:phosphatidylserine decarboxylase